MEQPGDDELDPVQPLHSTAYILRNGLVEIQQIYNQVQYWESLHPTKTRSYKIHNEYIIDVGWTYLIDGDEYFLSAITGSDRLAEERFLLHDVEESEIFEWVRNVLDGKKYGRRKRKRRLQ